MLSRYITLRASITTAKDNKFYLSRFFFQRKQVVHVDNLHELSRLVFSEK